MKLKNSITLEKKGREFYVQRLASFKYQDEQYIAAGRRGGSIQIYRVKTDEVTLAYAYGNNLYQSVEGSEDHFVSLIFKDGCLHSCSCLGKVVIQSLSPMFNQNHVDDFHTLNYLSLSVSSPVTCFKLHPFHKWVSVSGGKDRELEINDFYALTHLWKSKHSSLFEDIYLDEEHCETKWIQDLMIIGATAAASRNMKLIIASKFGKLMLFDTTVSMYPLAVLEISVNKMFMFGEDKVLTLDSFNTAHLISIDEFQIVQTFNMIETGPMASIELIEDAEGDGFILFIGGSCGSIKSYRISGSIEDNSRYEIIPLSRFKFPKRSIIPVITIIP